MLVVELDLIVQMSEFLECGCMALHMLSRRAANLKNAVHAILEKARISRNRHVRCTTIAPDQPHWSL